MTILVTGATGNVGRPLIKQLLDAGHHVRALTRNPARAQLPAGVEVVAGDLADTATLTDVFTGVTAAHLIGFGGDDYRPLTNGAEIMELAVKAETRRVTVLKGEMEKTGLDRAIEASGVSWTALFPAEFMSNTHEWAESIKTEGVVREGFPEVRSALIHDADIASVALTALTTDGHAGKAYWLTGPEALTIPERVDVISSVTGREIRYVELSKDEMVERWRTEGYPESDIEFFLMVRSTPLEEGLTVQPTVEEVTGAPARTFAQWVRENAGAFRA